MRALLALVAVAVVASLVASTALACTAGGAVAEELFLPEPTLLPLYNLTPAFVVSPNRTVVGVLVEALSSSQNLVYGTFDIGVDGWRYGEYDPQNLLYWVWVNDSGYLDWGYAGFLAIDIPQSPTGATYGYQVMYVNFTTPKDAINASLSFAYYFWVSTYVALPSAELVVGVYDWSTGNLTTVATIPLNVASGLTPLPSGSSSWLTYSVNLTTYLQPGKTYALVLAAIWPEQVISTYNATLFFDDVELTVFRELRVFSGDVVYANYSYNSTLSVRITLAKLACLNSSIGISLVTGLQRSVPAINVTNCTVYQASSGWVTVSSNALQNELYVEVTYESPGGYLNATLRLEAVSGGHRVVETIYINASTR